MSNVKMNQIKAGKTVYRVHAFPYEGQPGYIDKLEIISRPKMHKDIGLFVGYRKMSKFFGHYVEGEFSLQDTGVIENNYNFHRLFNTRKAAEKYLNRMTTLCLTKAETHRAIRLARGKSEWYLFQDLYDIIHDDCIDNGTDIGMEYDYGLDAEFP